MAVRIGHDRASVSMPLLMPPSISPLKLPKRSSRVRARRAFVSSLEPRLCFAAAPATTYEQYMLELINRARANPAAEAARLGIDLNEGLAASSISTAAKQPLAINDKLTYA